MNVAEMPARLERPHLVLHERDERREDERHSAEDGGWDLVGEGLPAAGGRDDQHAPRPLDDAPRWLRAARGGSSRGRSSSGGPRPGRTAWESLRIPHRPGERNGCVRIDGRNKKSGPPGGDRAGRCQAPSGAPSRTRSHACPCGGMRRTPCARAVFVPRPRQRGRQNYLLLGMSHGSPRLARTPRRPSTGCATHRGPEGGMSGAPQGFVRARKVAPATS